MPAEVRHVRSTLSTRRSDPVEGRALTRLRRTWRPLLALLLFSSGACSLAYEVLWFRYLRLVFGASTPATAVVTAIFMAGLGFGGLWWGRRADRRANPLALYARLEIGIALSALVSPWVIEAVRQIYATLGGTPALGLLGGTVVRVALSLLVMGLPTFLMGGTLPAAVRAFGSVGESRRSIGFLYGANTLGAVLGVLVPTLWSLETLGLRLSLWTACWINLLVAVAAGVLSRGVAPREPRGELPRPSGTLARRATESPAPVLAAAAAVGFVFFLLELVWYRMMAPLLGGSSYTFGILLAQILLGIGVGGAVYGRRVSRPDALSFATVCGLEALLVALPLAAGDRIALLAYVLRDLQLAGFWGSVIAWNTVAGVVVLGPAVAAGYQFPLLVALLGRGERDAGRDVGRAYAWNTLGAIMGSLAGGLGALPLLGAVVLWRLATALLAVLALIFALRGRRQPRSEAGESGPNGGGPRLSLARPVVLALIALTLLAARGPTAFWRQSPIGAGRLRMDATHSRPFVESVRDQNRALIWAADGVESNLAAAARNEYAFLVNGKADGSARSDAPTQVMGGLVGAALHPEARSALVIGLGTGSTAGWLARVPSMEHVDVVEIEPTVLRVAADCSPVNGNVLANPKVSILIGDGREVLQTLHRRYDIVFSEPSNPYRAGIASLFTEDFYRSVRERLNRNGLLLQWLQGYEVDPQLVRTAYATLRSVFPVVESWEIGRNDLLLMASGQRIRHDLPQLRERVTATPWREALASVWGVEGLEGLYSGFVATGGLADAIAVAEGGRTNTDDLPVLEFGFARNLGRLGLFDSQELRSLARRGGWRLPPQVAASLDPTALLDVRMARQVGMFGAPARLVGSPPEDLVSRNEARRAFAAGDLGLACLHWRLQPQPATMPIDLLLMAECRSEANEDDAVEWIQRLAVTRPSDARFALAQRAIAREDWPAAARHLEDGFRGLSEDPWVFPATLRRALDAVSRVAEEDSDGGRRLYQQLHEPLAMHLEDERRRLAAVDLARVIDFESLCQEALEPLEPWVPEIRDLLASRVACYRANRDPRLARAVRELRRFDATAPLELDSGVPIP